MGRRLPHCPYLKVKSSFWENFLKKKFRKRQKEEGIGILLDEFSKNSAWDGGGGDRNPY